MGSLDFENICRLCLDKDPIKDLCVKHEEFNGNYYFLISVCFSIQAEENDNLPKKMCENCTKILEDYYSFRSFVIDNDKKLKQLIALNNVSVNSEENEIIIEGEDYEYSPHIKIEDENSDKENFLQSIQLTKQMNENSTVLKNQNDNNDREYFEEYFFDSILTECEVKSEDDLDTDIESDNREDILESVYETNENDQDIDIENNDSLDDSSSVDNLQSIKFIKKLKKNRIIGKNVDHTYEEDNDFEKNHSDSEDNIISNKLIKVDYNYKMTDVQKNKDQDNNHDDNSKIDNSYGNDSALIEIITIECESSETKAGKKLIKKSYTDENNINKKRTTLECDQCGNFYSSLRTLNNHKEEIHNKNVIYKCQFCEKVFASMRCLNRHKKRHTEFQKQAAEGLKDNIVHTGEKQLICETCGKSFKRPEELRHHGYKHTGQFPYICDICSKGFPTRGKIISHIEAMHNMSKDYECHICHKRISNKWYLKVHLLTHTGPRILVCDTCGATFKTRSALFKHKKRENKKPGKYECDQCGKIYPYPESLYRHKFIHGEDRYQCSICGELFKLKTQFIRHENRHPDVKIQEDQQYPKVEYLCKVCEKAFLNHQSLAAHVETHIKSLEKSLKTKKAKKSLSCSYCGIVFKQRCLLKEHLQIHIHFECATCHRKFGQKLGLMAHIRRTHTKTIDTITPCFFCGKSFWQKQDLADHILKMHSRGSHECEVCNKRFIQDEDLTSHKKTHDNSSDCVKEVLQTSNLDQRIESDSLKQGTYECLICNRNFARKSYLLKHTKRKHTTKAFRSFKPIDDNFEIV